MAEKNFRLSRAYSHYPQDEAAQRELRERSRRLQKHSVPEFGVEVNQCNLLTFCCDESEYAIDYHSLVEILPVPVIARVPGVPAHIYGVMNYHSELLTVLDAQRLLGFASAQPQADSAILVVKAADLVFGLYVHMLIGSGSYSESEFRPFNADEKRNSFATGIWDERQTMLSMDALLADSEIIVEQV